MITFKTYQPSSKDIVRKKHVLDAKSATLGRFATQVALLLTGKNKKGYVPHLDMGDYVMVVNAADIAVSGRKEKQKIYYRHSGYPGGLKEITLSQMREKNPTKIIELAVRGMLPGNRLRDPRMRRLSVFAGERSVYGKKNN